MKRNEEKTHWENLGELIDDICNAIGKDRISDKKRLVPAGEDQVDTVLIMLLAHMRQHSEAPDEIYIEHIERLSRSACLWVKHQKNEENKK